MSETMMKGLVALNDGFSGSMEGPHIESLEPYVELRELPVPQPGDGEVLVKVSMARILLLQYMYRSTHL